jgi:hypothetical protein
VLLLTALVVAVGGPPLCCSFLFLQGCRSRQDTVEDPAQHGDR